MWPDSSGSRSTSSTAAAELRQFVEEQHAVVRQRDLARARIAAAADQRHRGGACGAARGTGARRQLADVVEARH